jgi:hypothetical protein
VEEANIVSRRARLLLEVSSSLFTMLEVGVEESDAEGETKRVSRVTLLLLGVGGGEADEMSLENKRRERGIYR